MDMVADGRMLLFTEAVELVVSIAATLGNFDILTLHLRQNKPNQPWSKVTSRQIPPDTFHELWMRRGLRNTNMNITIPVPHP